jgi:hypothetical protein
VVADSPRTRSPAAARGVAQTKRTRGAVDAAALELAAHSALAHAVAVAALIGAAVVAGRTASVDPRASAPEKERTRIPAPAPNRRGVTPATMLAVPPGSILQSMRIAGSEGSAAVPDPTM